MQGPPRQKQLQNPNHECPICYRTFNSRAIENHIELCKKKIEHAQKDLNKNAIGYLGTQNPKLNVYEAQAE